MKYGFVEGVLLLGLIATVIITAIQFTIFVPLFTLLLIFIYYKVIEAEEEVKKELKREIEGLRRDLRGQFTIAGLFAVFIMLIITMKLMPDIVSYCDSIASTLEDKGYTIASFLVKLIPASIVISILSAIYFYAKPIIMKEG